MTDRWDDIAEKLKASPDISPRSQAKNDAIFNAMAEFDKKNAKVRQGTQSGHRLKDRLQWLQQTLIGDGMMKKGYVIAGGVCVGMLTVGLLNTSYLTQMMPGGVSPEALHDKADPAAETIATESAEDEFAVLMSKHEKVSKDAEVSSKRADSLAQVAQVPMAREEASRAIVGNSGGAPAPAAAMIGMSAPADSMIPPMVQYQGNDKFEDVKPNPIVQVAEEPVSTFSIDVDTSSYAFVRASLNNNVLPQQDAVRVEEMVNYFPYDYALPKDKSVPFSTTMAVFPSPWNKATKLLHIGIKGYDVKPAEQPRSNLVFLLDTSGSMYEPNKLPLLQNSMKMLLDSLQPEDTVAIVTYAGSAGVALEPTQVKDKAKIITALDSLSAGGSTAGAEGIRQAYQLAETHFNKEGVNRVILATDGDFNVGITAPEELKSFVERKRESGIFLSVLGFGRGNYNDEMMQTLAQNGNGNSAYIDSINEARKVLVDEATSTLFPIAKDVKIQVEFNPGKVSEYRLIGYETRILNREDFNNDKVDAGDIGAGHSVTAIYEMTPADSKTQSIDALRYQEKATKPVSKSDEYAFVKIRYKLPKSNTSKLITEAVDKAVELPKLAYTSTETRFATAVAGFAQLLRGDAHLHGFGYDDVIELAQGAKGEDAYGYRAEFINLVRLAKNAPALEKLQ